MTKGLYSDTQGEPPSFNTWRVAWLTNIATPYRVPVWNELGSRLTLEVFLC